MESKQKNIFSAENLFHKVLKISAKLAFNTLRTNGPYECPSYDIDVFVGRRYWNHLLFAKVKNPQEKMNRLLVIHCVTEILESGKVVMEDDTFIRIEKEIGGVNFGCVLLKTTIKIVLLSSFIAYKKNNLP